ncbi:MAG: hypothetical protein MUC29_06705 [Pyrinomonadaceae bacterium]|nr:hypothetical protein [Pyrinomonadaceae bacterium]
MCRLKIFSFILILILSGCFSAEKKETTSKATPLPPNNSESQPIIEKKEPMKEAIERPKKQKFQESLTEILPKRGMNLGTICDESDSVSKRILHEYGSIFIANESVLPPTVCMFTSDEEVNNFQAKAGISSENVNGTQIELQPNAMKALLSAVEEAKAQGLSITPRGGEESARRGYADTLRLWKSRFEPACEHWLGKGKLNAEQIEKLKVLPIKEQVKEVLELEKDGIYFNTFFNNSILYSVAAPGTSQHLSMLALDVEEFGNKRVREILAKNGWFRTVQNDDPHFTYLGRSEAELESFGLKKIENDKGEYWIPNV